MALVCRDPMLVETHKTPITREAYEKLMQLCADSGCSRNGHRGNKCLFSLDARRYSNVHAWGHPAFPSIRAPSGPFPHGLVKVAPNHRSIKLVESPTSWGVSIAALIARGPDILPPEYYSTPFNTDYDVCTYSFMLRPWIRDQVCSAVALECHGERMSMASLLRHIAVNMVCAVREKTTGLSNLDIFKLLLHIYLRQLVATGYTAEEKNIFMEVVWVDASFT
ncbi:hypothetical protein BDN71DRAFT_1591719 [Pleurotus eryngii]|uniref:Uncharacterized protein n=1 Tax=Pleurotus eryngii TaxID=5323 RepID=A0A9P5ZQC6_PLEER|nr:hypothetical protein BDN71DRAFT_1591719 [Pleurotus eryngii]